jgi:hypothetical protein
VILHFAKLPAGMYVIHVLQNGNASVTSMIIKE